MDPLLLGRKVARRGGRVAQGFLRFLMRGKTAELAVGVDIGAAIGGFITSLVSDVVTPILGFFFGATTPFKDQILYLGHDELKWGDFLNSLLSFLIVCAVVYFFIIIPMNAATTNAFFKDPDDPALRKCPECQSDIPITAKRCMYCTQAVPPEDVPL